LHALAARFRAYAAVFVPARVPLAFITAQATRRRAGDAHPTNELVIRAGAPGGEASRDIADIGAVEIEPDALGQLLDHFLGKASVGARGARLGAGITLLDATDQSIVGAAARIWVHTDHLLNLHAFLSGLAVAPRAGNANPAATVRMKPDLWAYTALHNDGSLGRVHTSQRGPRRILGTRAAGAALEIHASTRTIDLGPSASLGGHHDHRLPCPLLDGLLVSHRHGQANDGWHRRVGAPHRRGVCDGVLAGGRA
jgi:hypothetical protein